MGQKHHYRILLVGDAADLIGSIEAQLQASGQSVVCAGAGSDGLRLLRDGLPDLVIVTIPMNEDDALGLCRSIRAESAVPVIAVSRDGGEQACVDALSAGADDFVTAAVGQREFSARIQSAVRRAGAEPYRCGSADLRSNPDTEGVLRSGRVRLELTTCRVSVNGAVRTLTPNEFRLMAVFLRAPGEVFTREDLRRRVWPDDQHSLHLVEVHIANLRAKIETDPHHPTYIVTVRSRGYKFAAQS